MTDVARPVAMWDDRPLSEPWWPVAWGAAPAWTDEAAADVRCINLDPTGPWSGVGASRRGRLHAHRGAAREDAIALRRAGGATCAVVADGAGSKPLSRVGAALACESVMDSLVGDAGRAQTAAALRAVITAALTAADNALRTLADQHGIPASDLRTTLLVAVIVDTPDGGLLGAGQIGDGTVAAEDAAGTVRVLTLGDGGEFAGEVAHFVPDPGALAHGIAGIVVEPLAGTRSVLVCSDGVDDCFYPMSLLGPLLLAQLRTGVTEGAPGMVQRPGGPVLRADDPSAALAEWLTYEKRGENDDRTLAVLWRGEG
jgi:hypothetical protein